MSKLQELIQRLCPDGVEYKPLGEVGTFTRGNGLQKKDFTESGVGCIHYGQIYTYYGTVAYETKSFVSSELSKKLLKVNPGDLVIACTSENVEDVGKAVAWLGKSEIVTGGHSVVFRHTLNPKYVAYFFQTQMFFSQKKRFAYGAKVIDIRTNDLARIVIPVPPVEVQEEIVKILDRFADYAAELQAELQARKQQYEYYRNLLLTFNPSACGCGTDDDQQIGVTAWGGDSYKIHWKKLGDIMDICRGASPRPIRNFLTSSENGIPWIKIGDVSPNSKYIISTAQFITHEGVAKSRLLKKGDFILSNSMSFGRPYILNIDGCIHDGWVALSNYQPSFNADFLYHLLKSDFIQKYWQKKAGQGGAVSNLNSEIIASTLIPIPPLEVQERIVAILDRFETLVNDLNEGLPREIELRRKQYEHYRDRLLAFPDISRPGTKQRI